MQILGFSPRGKYVEQNARKKNAVAIAQVCEVRINCEFE
jgi:hypothetical protein